MWLKEKSPVLVSEMYVYLGQDHFKNPTQVPIRKVMHKHQLNLILKSQFIPALGEKNPTKYLTLCYCSHKESDIRLAKVELL